MEAAGANESVARLVERCEPDLLDDWMRTQLASMTRRADLINEAQMRQQSKQFLTAFRQALDKGTLSNANDDGWSGVRDVLGQISAVRARMGFSPRETALFVFSFKQPLFERLRTELPPEQGTDVAWLLNEAIDTLALDTLESFQQSREEIIARQQQELLELSTPVVQLWDDVLALPLIGTLDSARTQIVMESLLQAIVDTGASIAIIDITGVPTVDTLVAQHLLKTVAAARLMGADCIISGIRPQIAQTIVHLGVDLADVVTKATLADAFTMALSRVGASVIRAA